MYMYMYMPTVGSKTYAQVFHTSTICNPTHFDINVTEQILQTITFRGGGGGGGGIPVSAAIDQRI